MHIQFAELPVFDQDRAKAFYIASFGCELAADVPMGQDGWRWIELRFPDAVTNLHFIRRKDEVPSDHPVLMLIDDKVEATMAQLRARGVHIIGEPEAAPWDPGRIAASFRDSEGNCIGISTR